MLSCSGQHFCREWSFWHCCVNVHSPDNQYGWLAATLSSAFLPYTTGFKLAYRCVCRFLEYQLLHEQGWSCRLSLWRTKAAAAVRVPAHRQRFAAVWRTGARKSDPGQVRVREHGCKFVGCISAALTHRVRVRANNNAIPTFVVKALGLRLYPSSAFYPFLYPTANSKNS